MPSAKTLKRLEGLEAVIRAPEPPAKLQSALGVFLIAFRLGGWREDGHESVAEAYARAAGYESSMDLQHGLREPDEFNSRYLAALAKMLRAEGCEPDTATLRREAGRRKPRHHGRAKGRDAVARRMHRWDASTRGNNRVVEKNNWGTNENRCDFC